MKCYLHFTILLIYIQRLRTETSHLSSEYCSDVNQGLDLVLFLALPGPISSTPPPPPDGPAEKQGPPPGFGASGHSQPKGDLHGKISIPDMEGHPTEPHCNEGTASNTSVRWCPLGMPDTMGNTDWALHSPVYSTTVTNFFSCVSPYLKQSNSFSIWNIYSSIIYSPA